MTSMITAMVDQQKRIAAEKAFRWFAAKGVDAVLCPGDIAHSGNIRELEAFADVWHRVFPENGEWGTGNG